MPIWWTAIMPIISPAGAFTAGAVMGMVQTVDGAGSGLDADTLDGHHADYFLPAGAFTAGAVMGMVQSVDGTGSGLDADTLDGHQSDYFMPATSADLFAPIPTNADGLGQIVQLAVPGGYTGNKTLPGGPETVWFFFMVNNGSGTTGVANGGTQTAGTATNFTALPGASSAPRLWRASPQGRALARARAACLRGPMRTPEDAPTDPDKLIRFGAVAAVSGARITVTLDDGAVSPPMRWIEARAGRTRTHSRPAQGQQAVILAPAAKSGWAWPFWACPAMRFR
jgi:hypothetical protein